MIDMIYQWPIRFRFGFYFLPFRIGLESGPVPLRLLAGRMLQNVDKQVLRIRRIFGRPVTDALHVVPSEDRVGVVSEARLQSIHFTFVDVIQAQFVNVMRRLWVGRAELAEGEHYRGPAKKE